MTDYSIKGVRPKEGVGWAEFLPEGNLQISPTLSDILIVDRPEWEKLKRWVDDNWPVEAGK